MVPHLITALTGPINELEQRMLDAMPAIERWFRLEWMEHTPPFYGAVDLRNAGFKLAPMGCNLFPSGWENLTPEMLPLAVQAAMASIEKICPEARNLLIIPENHAERNSFYLANIAQLQRIFERAGLNVRLGSIDPEIKKPTPIALPTGETVVLEPVLRSARRLGLADFDPCTLLLNNDLAAGPPGILEELHEQFLLPPLHAGWSVRRRSQHVKAYEEVAKRFGKMLGIDPWLVTPICSLAEPWSEAVPAAQALEALQTKVDGVLSKVRRKYKEYGIQERPFVFLKPDQGSCGAGVLTLRDAKALEALWPSLQQGHAPAAPGIHASGVLVQEGVRTLERMHDSVAEPVVYLMDRHVVGGFYRMHTERGDEENLNDPGARFVPLAFEKGTYLPQPGVRPGVSAPNRFYMYGVIARLSILAASYELEAADPEAERYD